jgi:hypothetical protein
VKLFFCKSETFILFFGVYSNQKSIIRILGFKQCPINLAGEVFLYVLWFQEIFRDLMLKGVPITCSYVIWNQWHIFGAVQVGVVVPCCQLVQSHNVMHY